MIETHVSAPVSDIDISDGFLEWPDVEGRITAVESNASDLLGVALREGVLIEDLSLEEIISNLPLNQAPLNFGQSISSPDSIDESSTSCSPPHSPDSCQWEVASNSSTDTCQTSSPVQQLLATKITATPIASTFATLRPMANAVVFPKPSAISYAVGESSIGDMQASSKRRLQDTSPADWKRVKRDTRLMKNRESANRSRLRRKQQMDFLEEENSRLKAQVTVLNNKVSVYKAENDTLKRHNQFLETLLVQQQKMPQNLSFSTAHKSHDIQNVCETSSPEDNALNDDGVAHGPPGMLMLGVVFSVSLAGTFPWLDSLGLQGNGALFSEEQAGQPRSGRVLQYYADGSEGSGAKIPCMSALLLSRNLSGMEGLFIRALILLGLVIVFLLMWDVLKRITLWARESLSSRSSSKSFASSKLVRGLPLCFVKEKGC